MTDGEPEPFRMSTDPGAADDEMAEAADEDGADAPADDVDDPADAPLPGGAESIADLIGEASRTAAEQAVQEATGTAPVDRSSDVWGSTDDGDDDDEDLDALWSAAADRHRGSHVFDDVLGPDDDWSSTPRMPPAAADPTIGVGSGTGTDDEPEPEVFKLSVDDSADDQAPVPATPDVPQVHGPDDEDDPEIFRFAAGPATTAPAVVPDHVPEAGRDEPDMFAFAFDDRPAEAGEEPSDDGVRTGPDDGDPQASVMQDDDPADDGAATEPTTQEEPVSQEPEAGDGEQDPWAATPDAHDGADDLWATSTQSVEPDWDAAPDDDAPWTTDTADADAADDADAAPDDEEHADEAWTFDVRDDVVAWGEDPADLTDDDQETVGEDGEEPTLAESARPRVDTGWQDLSDVPSRWTIDPAPTGEDDGFSDAAVAASAPDPDTFSALLGDDDEDAADEDGGDADAGDEDALDGTDAADADAAEAHDADDDNDGFLPDDEPLAPTREPDPPFQTDSAALGDVIDDLIGDLGPAPARPGDAGDDRDDLDDALADLDDFDDIGRTAPDAADAAPTDEPVASAPAAPTPPDLAAMPPPTDQPAPAADDLLAASPPPALPSDATPAPPAPAPAQDAPDGTPDDAPDPQAGTTESTDEAAEPEPSEPEPTPTPQGMTFASKPKKRGLFGR